MDILRFVNPTSAIGYMYLLFFLDDHNRYLTVSPLKTKDEELYYFEKNDN